MNEGCRDTLHRAYLFLDGEVLSESERLEIGEHLEACRPCYERYGLDEDITRLVARLRHCERCPEGLRTRIRTLLQS